MELKICHLYPDVLNLYGDRGNILCLKKRLEWRGIECRVFGLPIGEGSSLGDFDLFFIGGGQDFEQSLLQDDLAQGKKESIKAAVTDGIPFLCICGGYQLMGEYYEQKNGKKLEYIGALPLYTVGGELRQVGNILTETEFGEIVGFENHIGRTYLEKGTEAFGTVKIGFGNNGEDGTEGAVYNNVFCTYLHGPVLPKNPKMCDGILLRALGRKYGTRELAPLQDIYEEEAHKHMIRQIQKANMPKKNGR